MQAFVLVRPLECGNTDPIVKYLKGLNGGASKALDIYKADRRSYVFARVETSDLESMEALMGELDSLDCWGHAIGLVIREPSDEQMIKLVESHMKEYLIQSRYTNV